MWLIKHPLTKSPYKTRSKDRRSPIQLSTSTDSSPNEKHLKINKNLYKKQNIETMNKFRLLEKMETVTPNYLNPKQ